MLCCCYVQPGQYARSLRKVDNWAAGRAAVSRGGVWDGVQAIPGVWPLMAVEVGAIGSRPMGRCLSQML